MHNVKIAADRIGSGNPFYGKKHSASNKVKWATNKLNNQFALGHKHDENSKAKMKLKRIGKKPSLGHSPNEKQRENIGNGVKKAFIANPNIRKIQLFHNFSHKRFPYIDKDGQIIYMRSSWEIKYAKHLDGNDVVWFYELKGFSLELSHTYFPDFYLPKTNTWIEIKGFFAPGAKEKIESFQKMYPSEKLIILRGDDLKRLGLDIYNKNA